MRSESAHARTNCTHAPALDLSRPRDLAALALIATAVIALTAVELTGRARRPARLTVATPLAAVIGTNTGRDRSGG